MLVDLLELSKKTDGTAEIQIVLQQKEELEGRLNSSRQAKDNLQLENDRLQQETEQLQHEKETLHHRFGKFIKHNTKYFPLSYAVSWYI